MESSNRGISLLRGTFCRLLRHNMFEVHYEDTPMEENYANYKHGADQDDYYW